MKILLTSPSFPPDSGGVAEVVNKQYSGLLKLNHDVHVLSGSTIECFEATNRIHRFPILYRGFPGYAAGDFFGVSDKNLKKNYIDFVCDLNPDIVVAHCWQAWTTDWLFDGLCKIKSKKILFSHGTSVNSITDTFGFIRYLRWRAYAMKRMPRYLEQVNAFIALSDFSDNDRFFDVSLAKSLSKPIDIIANSYAVALEDGQKKIEKKPIVLCVGRYTAEKNFEDVLDAFIKINNKEWHLVFCGSSETNYLHRLKNKCIDKGFVNNVTFNVNLSMSEILSLYKTASIFAFASKTECQPLVILDAMACSVPYISTNVGCVSSLGGGVVVNDKKEFIYHLQRLMSDLNLRIALGCEGFRFAEINHRPSSNILKFEKVLKRVIAVK